MPDVRRGAGGAQIQGAGGWGGQSTNLGDILERVLDKGLVIAGDIRVNLLDIELLTIKLRLVIASLETAKSVGINWWESDPWLNADAADRQERRRAAGGDGGRELADLEDENRQLRNRVAELESGDRPEAGAADDEVRARPGAGRRSRD
ncbi:MAG: gas vesicle protein [Streptosporangiaceae bacterium]|nr:gas vesicle protein [Streptosporangiaceae bacterium]